MHNFRFGTTVLLAIFAAGCDDGAKPTDSGDDSDNDTGDTSTPDCPDSSPALTWYADADADGHGDSAAPTEACERPTAHVDNSDDCDDGNAAINPGAAELCNGIDDNCDLVIDDGLGVTLYADADGDTFGDPDAPTVACDGAGAFVADNTDCDDGDAAINGAAVDLCSGVDEDCDTVLDDALTATLVAADGAVTDISEVLRAGTGASPSYIGDQEAYQVVVAEGTVNLCEGTWYAKVVLAQIGSDLTVRGLYGPDVTTLTTDGTSGTGDDGSVVAVTGATLTLEGVTVSGGLGSEDNTKGGGVAITQNGGVAGTPNVTFNDVIITGNSTAYGGGIALFDYASAVLNDTLVIGNTASAVGGGLWIQEHGEVECTVSALGTGGFVANSAPIAGGLYFSGKVNGTLNSVGCDWGDAGTDDNATNDIQRQPHSENAWCFGNSTATTDTVTCDETGCVGTNLVTCP
ncbi:MAG: hypothetical protein EXR71_02730 [Myxococcales bacterium]|nr:hypothetical protein [Myxococcales bacterium]